MKSSDARRKYFTLHTGYFILEIFFMGPYLFKGLISIDGPIGSVAVRIYFCEGFFQDFI